MSDGWDKELARDAKESRERLIKSGLKLFATKGFDGTTVRDIADDAGVNISLVSYYFQGKLGLYRTCIEEFARARGEKAKMLLGRSVESAEEFKLRLRLLAEDIMDFQLENPYPCQMVMREIDQGLPNAKDIFQNTLLKTYQLLVEFFSEAQKKGIVDKSVFPFVLPTFFQGILFHLPRVEIIRKTFLDQSGADPEVRREYIDQLVNLFANGTLSREK